MKVVELTKKDFLEKVVNYEKNPDKWVFEGNKPCVVDFYATWCGPCKMLAPVLDEMATEYADKVDFYKIDSDKEEDLSAAFNIRSVPTLLFCPMTGNPQIVSGAMGKEDLKKIIEDVLLKKE